MNAKNAYGKYKEQSVLTATQPELTLMLYNGCIKFINKSIQALENKNYQEVNYFSQRSQMIILELKETLDFEYELSEQFDKLYDFVYESLLNGNLEKDEKYFKDALGIIRDFRDTWQNAMKIYGEQTTNDLVASY